MAVKYARGVGGSWTTNATWSTTSGGGADTTAPTAADDAILDANSGGITINAGAVCRSIDCTGYTGTLTHTAAVTFAIGDATAGAGNNALKFVAAMTYTLGNTDTSNITFISTSATEQTVDFANKITGRVTFNGVGGNWKYTGAHRTTSFRFGVGVYLSAGSLNLNGQTLSLSHLQADGAAVKVLTFGAATISVNSSSGMDFSGATNLTVNSSTEVITYTAGGNANLRGGSYAFNKLVTSSLSATLANGTFNEVQVSASSGTLTISNGTITLLTLSGNCSTNINGGTITTINVTATGATVGGTAASCATLTVNTVVPTFTLAANVTATSTINFTGNTAASRLLVQSNTAGTQRTITNTGATMNWSNVDFMDIALSSAYDASAITGGSGDCGGNSNITFTTAATQTWNGTTGGNWSTNAWSGRVPLPQDNVNLGVAFNQTAVLLNGGASGRIGLGNMGSFGSNLGSGFYCKFTINSTTASADATVLGTENRDAQFITISLNTGSGSSGRLGVAIRDNAGLTLAGYASVGVNAGTTMTIEVIVNPATNNIIINKNGVPQSITYTAQNTPATFVNFSALAFTQGVNIGALGNGFGAFTLVASATKLHNLSIGTSSLNLYGSYVMTEGTGTSIADSSGNGNNGTFSGTTSPSWSTLNQIITLDVARGGKSIDWTGATGSPTWNYGGKTAFGSLTLISGMSLGQSGIFTLAGRGNYTITSAGKTYPDSITINALGGTYTLNDAFSQNNDFRLTNGTFNRSTYTFQVSTFTGNAGCSFLGTGQINLATAGSTTIWTANSGLIMDAVPANIAIVTAITGNRTFAGGGKTYGILAYTVAGSTGQLTITGSNTFGTINFSDTSNARTLQFTSGTTTTILNTFNVNGTSGKLMTINSSASGSPATLSKTSGTVVCDYLSIKDSTATGGALWYAGNNSLNVSGNSGWIFGTPFLPQIVIM